MTIEELYNLFNDDCTELNTQGHYTSTDECKAIRMVLDVIKELQAHREAWEKVVSELWMEGMNMTGEYQGVWVRYRDIERVIDTNRPKEGDNE